MVPPALRTYTPPAFSEPAPFSEAFPRGIVPATTARFSRSFAAYVAFFLSGASSLIFQTIWTRMLHHVFGATSVAISTVLTVFMAGLGLGAWLGGRYANRIKHPIITYAIAEIGVGVWGLLVPLLVRSDGWLATVNAFLRAELGAESGLFMIARFLCVAPILLVPTTLMGSTLPLLTRHFVAVDQDARQAGARVGVLYALNTFGAATGPVLSAFVLLPIIHLSNTNIVACSMNFTLAAIILVSRRYLLEGAWKPGERLSFWPQREEVGAPEPAPIPTAAAPPEEPAEPESAEPAPVERDATKEPSEHDKLGEVVPSDAVVGAYRDAPERLDEAPRASKAPKTKGKGKKAAAKKDAKPKKDVQAARASEPEPKKKPKAERVPAAPKPSAEAPIPELARKFAFLAFAASGTAALCYEVVWSRALAMTIGSSIYTFALILETFLVGIAAGAAAMSAFLAQRSRPYIGVAITSFVLVALANVPWAIDMVDPADREVRLDGSFGSWLLLTGLFGAPVVLAAVFSHLMPSSESDEVDQLRPTSILKTVVTVAMPALPVLAAFVNTFHFPGYLPKIIFSVVVAIALFIVMCALLHRAPTLLLAVVQLFIAGATLVSYIWQDEIPRAFAQLVVGIPTGGHRDWAMALADNVGQVRLYMMFTIALCTFPATLGMGAMFPLTIRVWTSGGKKIATDVANVYTGNTIGSIVGAWLPGFVLFALIGAERTIHLGIALNMVLALLMLIAGVADPNEEGAFWSWRRLAAVLLPPVLGVAIAASVVTTVGDWPWWGGDWRSWLRAGSALACIGVGVVEYLWLRGRWEGTPANSSVNMAMIALPAVVGIALAAVMVDPAPTDPWALRSVLGALRALTAATGIALSAIHYYEVRSAVPPRPKKDGPPRPEADLPIWHAGSVYVLAPLIPGMLAALFLLTRHQDSLLRWNRSHMTLGVFRLSYAEDMLDEETWGEPELVYYNDGLTTTVSVESWGRHYALKNNGKVDASNGDDMPTQINVATYPLMFHERGPRNLDVAIVGFGSGVTVGSVMKFPVRRVDVIELEQSIIEAARFFEEVNGLSYALPYWPFVDMDRLSIINDDGRNYLASTDRQYDVIISEPSNPWITGVSDLFTVDHWQITKRRLRPGGIYCQWVQLYELSPGNIKTIYRTFAEQFDHVIVLSADDRSSDTVMLGSDRPIQLDLERLRRVYGIAGVSDELERGNVYTPYDVLARVLLANREEVLQYTQIERHDRGGTWVPDLASTNAGPCERPTCVREPALLNTDDNARIEFAAPDDLIGFARYEGYLGTIYSDDWPYGNPLRAEAARGTPLLGSFGTGDEASRNYAELAMSMIAHGRYGWAGDLIEESQRVGRSRETVIASEVFLHLVTTSNEPAVHIEPPVPGPDMDRATADQLVDGFDQVREAVDEEAYSAALVAMEAIPAPLRNHSGPGMRLLYAYLLYKGADGSAAHYRRAIEHLDDLLRSDEDYVLRHPEIYYYLARSYAEDGDFGAALRTMRAYVEARLAPPLNEDAAEVPEPAAGEAPATDAPGESAKDEHTDRG
jgi:spermidine synthase